MASKPRYKIVSDNSSFHATWKCHNDDWFLKWKWAKQLYLDLLQKYSPKYGVVFHSYNFMDNHPHLIGKIGKREDFSSMFRDVNSVFAKRVNKVLGRSGQVIKDRMKTPEIQTDEHMLNAMVYADLNQCRAGKRKRPEHNDYSSYNHYAYGKKTPLVKPCETYMALGKTAKQRQRNYKRLVYSMLERNYYINISDTYFIGDPLWVLRRYEELRGAVRRKRRDNLSNINAPPP